MDFKHKSAGGIDLFGVHGHETGGAEQALACELSQLLADHYPGHLWRIGVNSEGKVIDIFNQRVSNDYGWRIRFYEAYTHDDLRKEIIRAGGEILERGGLPRGKYTGEQVDFVEGITKLQYQPAVQRNIHKYAELLNGNRPTHKH
jgi:hypothetical protein